jgi:hypothetical protein
MQSHEHAVIGAFASAGAGIGLWGSDPAVLVAAIVAGTLVSVFVDLDHFLLARYYAGDWSHLRSCVTDPVYAFTRQEVVFADLPAMERERIATHLVIATVAVPALWTVASSVGAFVLAVLVVHIGCDLLRDAGLA